MHLGLNRVDRGIDRAIALGLGHHLFALDRKGHPRLRPLAGFRFLRKRQKLVVLIALFNRIARDQGLQVFIKDFRLTIGQIFKPREGFV